MGAHEVTCLQVLCGHTGQSELVMTRAASSCFGLLQAPLWTLTKACALWGEKVQVSWCADLVGEVLPKARGPALLGISEAL